MFACGWFPSLFELLVGAIALASLPAGIGFISLLITAVYRHNQRRNAQCAQEKEQFENWLALVPEPGADSTAMPVRLSGCSPTMVLSAHEAIEQGDSHALADPFAHSVFARPDPGHPRGRYPPFPR